MNYKPPEKKTVYAYNPLWGLLAYKEKSFIVISLYALK